MITRIQCINGLSLLRVLMAVDDLPELVDMSLHGCFAGFDVCFEALPASPAVLPGLGFSDRVLSDLKAKGSQTLASLLGRSTYG